VNTLWAMMNDPARATLWAALQAALLVVSAFFVAWYLYETRKMRKAAEDQVTRSQELIVAAQRQVDASLKQVEGAFRPAVVAMTVNLSSSPRLVNIGNGPAVDIEWSIPNSPLHGRVSYLEPHTSEDLPFDGEKPLYEASAETPAIIECTYRSISDWSYRSTNTFDIDRGAFTTTFSAGTRTVNS
jgi:hypothetical protein